MATEPIDTFIGDVLEASIKASQNVSNRVSDLGWEEAQKWAKRFADLYDSVEKVNDSMKVDRQLAWHSSDRNDIERKIEHYESMKMGQN